MLCLLHYFFSLCSTYSQLSPFTLAVLKDSGWYDVNYEVTQTTLDGKAIPYIFGKGYGLMDNIVSKGTFQLSTYAYWDYYHSEMKY